MLRRTKLSVWSLLAVVILSSAIWLHGEWPTAPQGSGKVRAAIAERAFLASPYFGTRSVNSWFDHRLPNYTEDDALVDYRGVESQEAYDGHNGIDFAMSYEPVLAVAPGQVTFAGWQNPSYRDFEYGLHVRISHGNGYASHYAHLSVVGVAAGDRVTAGQVIGTSGNTGHSTGPHLHFDVQHQNVPVDPYGWEGAGGDPTVAYFGPNATSVWLWSLGNVMLIDGGDQGTAIAAHREIGTTIIDDGASGFWASSGWTTHAAGYQGDMRYARVNSGENAEWRPNLVRGGVYDVGVYLPVDDYTTTWRAQFKVVPRTGYTQNTITDQKGTSNRWLRLGTFYMPAGISGAVSVSSNTGYPGAPPEPTDRYLGIDAVRFVEVEPSQYFVPLAARSTSMSPLANTWSSGLQAQNLSTSATANVSLAFYWALDTAHAGQLAATHTQTIAAGQSAAWHLPTRGISTRCRSAFADRWSSPPTSPSP